MAVETVSNEGTFDVVSGSKNLVLDIKIGDGQQDYAASVFLGPKSQGSELNTDLGKASKAKDKTLTVVVVIQDTLDETNWTSCTMVLTNGTHSESYGPFKKKAVNNLDTIIYTLKIDIA